MKGQKIDQLEECIIKNVYDFNPVPTSEVDFS